MPGLIPRFGRSRKLSLTDRHELLMHAVELHEAALPQREVEAGLIDRGVTPEMAKLISADALAKVEADVRRRVTLPVTAELPFNYYFLLGVTPTATSDEIRRAYRQKARRVHPDQHNQEFSRDTWTRLMQMVTDAHEVLTNPASRRAYDFIWRARSRETAAANRNRGDQRGDWESRFRWRIAEVAVLEGRLSEIVEEVVGRAAAGTPMGALASHFLALVAQYDDVILDIRTQSYSLPQAFEMFGDEVRREMVRKENLVPLLRRLGSALEGEVASTISSVGAEVDEKLSEVHLRQHLFDIRQAS